MTLCTWLRSVALFIGLVLCGGAMAIPAGQPDAHGRFADVVMIDGNVHCSGVLVEPRTVLTAAHCMVDGSGTPRWSVTQQARDGRSAAAFVRSVALGRFKGLTPGQQNSVDVQGDLAVLRLDRDLAIDPIRIFPQKQAIEPALKAKFQLLPARKAFAASSWDMARRVIAYREPIAIRARRGASRKLSCSGARPASDPAPWKRPIGTM